MRTESLFFSFRYKGITVCEICSSLLPRELLFVENLSRPRLRKEVTSFCIARKDRQCMSALVYVICVLHTLDDRLVWGLFEMSHFLFSVSLVLGIRKFLSQTFSKLITSHSHNFNLLFLCSRDVPHIPVKTGAC